MSDSFLHLTSAAIPLCASNIDTGRIFPSRFLRKSRAGGYAAYLFHDERFDEQGIARSDFVMNRPAYKGGRIIVAGANFGCGSSREAAVHALWDAGFRCVIAPSFGEIFRINCYRNGLPAIALPENAVQRFQHDLLRAPGSIVSIDLPSQLVTGPDGARHYFDIEMDRKRRLMLGENDYTLALQLFQKTAEFEVRYHMLFPWLRA